MYNTGRALLQYILYIMVVNGGLSHCCLMGPPPAM